MQELDLLIGAVCNVLSVYVGFKIIDVFLEKKRKLSVVTWLIYVMVWFINSVVAFGYQNTIATTASMIFLLFIAECLIYKGQLLQKFLSACFAVMFGVTFDMIVWAFSGYYIEILKYGRAVGTIMVSLLNMIGVVCLKKIIGKRDRMISLQNYYCMILVLIGNIVWIYVLETVAGEKNLQILMALCVMILIDLGMFYLYDRLGEAYEKEIEQQILQERIRAYQDQMNVMQQSQQGVEVLRHDMKNHICMLENYLEGENYQKAREYLQKMNSKVEVSGKYVDTGNVDVDMILNRKLSKAESLGCQIQTQINIPYELSIDGYDWNVLLGNLLDNALEALERTTKRKLNLFMGYCRGVLTIKIQNSFDGIVIKHGNTLSSRKNDGLMHGIGMQNVAEIVKKYDGDRYIHIEENWFQIQIILYL